ncbi:unnamed protein product, partial [Darwinula stevensoni]
ISPRHVDLVEEAEVPRGGEATVESGKAPLRLLRDGRARTLGRGCGEAGRGGRRDAERRDAKRRDSEERRSSALAGGRPERFADYRRISALPGRKRDAFRRTAFSTARSEKWTFLEDGLQAEPAGSRRTPEKSSADITPDPRVSSNESLREKKKEVDLPTKDTSSRTSVLPKRRIVHFDLKGAAPKADYLVRVLELVKGAGATGILLEWEDAFPFEGRLGGIAARDRYSVEEVERVLDAAGRLRLDVIPLVQTFGHLEFVLKTREFESLRESPGDPQALCPSDNESRAMVTETIDQVMRVHRRYGPTHLHVGCDEVFLLGLCPRCRSRAKNDLFLSHVEFVAHYVRKKHGLIPIVWDDMFRKLSPSDLADRDLAFVEPMVWVYAEDVYKFVPATTWNAYAGAFDRVWGASAFKGAFGETLVLPPLGRHLQNNLKWLEVFRKEAGKFQEFRGIVLTGWQRYDHFAVLCELLPAGIPSLVLDLVAVASGRKGRGLVQEARRILSCDGESAGETTYEGLGRCDFPGHEIFEAARRLQPLEERFARETSALRSKGWYTPYNLRHRFTSPMRIREVQDRLASLVESVESVGRDLHSALGLVFPTATVEEYLEQRLYGMWEEARELRDGLAAVAARGPIRNPELNLSPSSANQESRTQPLSFLSQSGIPNSTS